MRVWSRLRSISSFLALIDRTFKRRNTLQRNPRHPCGQWLLLSRPFRRTGRRFHIPFLRAPRLHYGNTDAAEKCYRDCSGVSEVPKRDGQEDGSQRSQCW